ncbi:MAG: molybdopterin-guanine dinucleotide biosynthesis protein B [Candidatus Tectomicrobia bacterium]|uniref:Molybdopterin-guanine dinucleotide biosynthesis protein B n=1 Tax=Tectimicrobiota bacterium TaxID=2528274 RepID=A0A932FY32_UNCTE|nr:molybdopterin-guanine dinucleotide biosynthesis protein B [Candidatus Tectomicrobia bacterium]
MVPIVSIVGRSDSGKTTFLEKLIPELTRRGYRVATIKHDTHGFEVDREGKDSWRHARAGAQAVVISSPRKLALIKQVEADLTLDQIAPLIGKVDLILTEGYKREDKPKIEVYRRVAHPEPLCTSENQLNSMVTEDEVEVGEVPRFGLEDAAGVADHLEAVILKVDPPQARVRLQIDGVPIPLSAFVQSFIEGTVRGMVSALKGQDGRGRIVMEIDEG